MRNGNVNAGPRLAGHSTRARSLLRARRRHATLCALASICGLAVHSSQAQAAGYWNLDRGPSNYGRGGANIADTQDPIALYLNPAALAGLDGLQLIVDVSAVNDSRRFGREKDVLEHKLHTYTPVENQAQKYLPTPGLFATYRVLDEDLARLTVAFGVYGPPRTDDVFDADGPQRYSEIESHHLQISYTAGAGVELPWLKLRLGAAAMIISQIMDTRLKLYAPVLGLDYGHPEDPTFDIDVHVNARDNAIPCGILGASVSPTPWLVLAASYQLGYDIDARGTADIALSDVYGSLARVEGQDLEVALHMAPIARFAARYVDPRQGFDIELALVWERWSRNDTTSLTPRDVYVVVGGTPDGRIAVPQFQIENDWRDALSVRLGGAARVLPELLTLRAGAYYERSATKPNRTAAGAFDLDKIGGTLGGRVEIPNDFWVDLAFGYAYWIPREITASDIRLYSVIAQQDLHPIGNGKYSNTQIFLMAGLGAKIDI